MRPKQLGAGGRCSNAGWRSRCLYLANWRLKKQLARHSRTEMITGKPSKQDPEFVLHSWTVWVQIPRTILSKPWSTACLPSFRLAGHLNLKRMYLTKLQRWEAAYTWYHYSGGLTCLISLHGGHRSHSRAGDVPQKRDWGQHDCHIDLHSPHVCFRLQHA